MIMPGRDYNAEKYRFGYNNGSESDNEINGVSNFYTTFYRGLDVRIAKWISLDPVKSPGGSPYVAMNNNPIQFNDPNGDVVGGDKKGMENYSKGRESITNNMKNISSQIDAIKNNPTSSNQQSLPGLQEKLDAYVAANTELDLMEKSPIIYFIKSGDGPITNANGKAVNGQTTAQGTILTLNIYDNSIGTLFHELKHGFQFQVGELAMGESGKDLPGIHDQSDEMDAVNREQLMRFDKANVYQNEAALLKDFDYGDLPTGQHTIYNTSGSAYYKVPNSEKLNVTLERNAMRNFTIYYNNYIIDKNKAMQRDAQPSHGIHWFINQLKTY